MIEKIGHYSMNNTPSIYDEEAMTALELSGRTASKVNECIEAVNKNTEETERQTKEIIPNAIDEHINNHINNGTFDKSIDNYIGNLSEKVNNLIGVIPEGNITSMDADVINARLDYNNNSHDTLRSAIVSQFDRAIYESNRDYLTNRLNPKSITVGKYVDPTTGILYDGNYWTSDFIYIRYGEKLDIKLPNDAKARFIVCYDSARKVIAGAGVENHSTITQSGDISFIRFSVNDTYTAEECCVMERDFYTTFINYGEFVKKSDIVPEYNIQNACFYNRLVKEKCSIGKYPSHITGEILDNADYVCTHFIRVGPKERLKFATSRNGVDKYYPMIRTIAYYIPDDLTFIPAISTEYANDIYNPFDYDIYCRFGFSIGEVKREWEAGNIMVGEITNDDDPFLSIGEVVVKSRSSDVGINRLSKEVDNLIEKTNTLTSFTPKPIYYGTIYAGVNYINEKFYNPYAVPYVRKNMSFTFKGKIRDTFDKFTMGFGGPTLANSVWVEIDPSMIYVYYNDGVTIQSPIITLHNLIIDKYFNCSLSIRENGKWIINITSNGNVYNYDFTFNDLVPWMPFYFNSTHEMYDATFMTNYESLKNDIWIIGDSYIGNNIEDTRLYSHLRNIAKECLIISKSGMTSKEGATIISDLLSMGVGQPKYLIWQLGMNDGTTVDEYQTAIQKVKSVYSGELILTRIPSVPTLSKTAINNFIDSTGNRIIDFKGAVQNSDDSSWLSGLLSSDGVHPTALGANVLATQMIIDVPELKA